MGPTSDILQFVNIDGRDIATAFHPASEQRLVIFCHGFRGSKSGPNRFFVRLARRLQQAGICSLRFDQYGSGDSAGDFFDSSFNDWSATTKRLAQRYIQDGYQVSLLGQSMGGAAVLVAAADLGSSLSSVIAWVPDPSIDALQPDGPFNEEGGQRVHWGYWQEAQDARIVQRFREISVPTLVFLATDDEFVSPENQQALLRACQPHQYIQILLDWTHSSWTYDQATQVIEQSAAFLVSHFKET